MTASNNTIKPAPQTSFRNERGKPVLLAGPCNAESETQVLETARLLKNIQGAAIFKAGIWTSHTRPHTVEGIGAAALPWLKKVKEQTGLRVACDVSNAQQAEDALAYDINILCLNGHAVVNPYVVHEIAAVLRGTGTSVLVSNPVYPDLGLWVSALEKLYHAGLNDLGAIHKGFAGEDQELYHSHPKWEYMLQLRRELPELPLLCDASHIAGKRSLLYPVAQRALDFGAEGLLLDIHHSPNNALSNQQQLMPQELNLLLNALETGVKLAETTALIDRLDALRQQAETLDNTLVELLLHRKAVSSQMGSYGLGNSTLNLQQDKWLEQLSSLLQPENRKAFSCCF